MILKIGQQIHKNNQKILLQQSPYILFFFILCIILFYILEPLKKQYMNNKKGAKTVGIFRNLTIKLILFSSIYIILFLLQNYYFNVYFQKHLHYQITKFLIKIRKKIDNQYFLKNNGEYNRLVQDSFKSLTELITEFFSNLLPQIIIICLLCYDFYQEAPKKYFYQLVGINFLWIITVFFLVYFLKKIQNPLYEKINHQKNKTYILQQQLKYKFFLLFSHDKYTNVQKKYLKSLKEQNDLEKNMSIFNKINYNIVLAALFFGVQFYFFYFMIRYEKDINICLKILLTQGLLLIAFNRVFHQIMPFVNNIVKYKNTIKSFNEIPIVSFGKKKVKTIKKINWKNLTYSVRSKKIIDNFSGKISLGEMIFIVGPSGCGKSTLIKILTKQLNPEKGKVIINGTNIKKYNQKNLYKKIKYISQKTNLLTGTIKYNLLLNKKISQKKIKKVLKTVKLWDFINSLPKKLETNIGNNGEELSGGQQKRLQLARALLHLKKGDIILLDEATSGLDPLLTQEVFQIFSKIKKDNIIIVISHKPSLFTYADRIIFFDKKIHFNNLKNLCRNNKKFKKIFQY